MIRRHTTTALIMHWMNAVLWLLLLGSGFALLANPSMQPAGAWWSAVWAYVLGEVGVLYLHMGLGLLWIALYAAHILLFFRQDVRPFLREVTRLSPRSDFVWCFRKSMWLLLDARKMRRLGLDPSLPPQGFYNAGQKMVGIAAVACSTLLVLTGVLLCFSLWLSGMENIVQWALLAHLICAGLMAVLLPVHIYMAAFAPGEEPSLRFMITGYVPEEFARHHNPLWVATLERKGGHTSKNDPFA